MMREERMTLSRRALARGVGEYNEVRLREARASTAPAPAQVRIEVTWRCDWRCVHCYQDTNMPKGPRTDRLLELVGELAGAGTAQVIVAGGEPLVRKDIIQFLAALRRAGIGVTLCTNGQLVDEPLARRLGGLITAAELSVLSGDDDIHDQLAGRRGAAAAAWRAAGLLRAEGVAVTIRTPLLKPAMGTFTRLARRCAGMAWHPDADLGGSSGGAEYPSRYRLSPAEIAEFYRDFPAYDPACGFAADAGLADGTRPAGSRRCFIDIDGNVYPGPDLDGAAGRTRVRGDTSSAVLGNVFREPFDRIWASSIDDHIGHIGHIGATAAAAPAGQASQPMWDR